MSSFGDALKGVKQLLLMQDQIQRLEKISDRQNATIDGMADDVIAIDKRLIRIETLVEVAMARAAPPSPPRLEG